MAHPLRRHSICAKLHSTLNKLLLSLFSAPFTLVNCLRRRSQLMRSTLFCSLHFSCKWGAWQQIIVVSLLGVIFPFLLSFSWPSDMRKKISAIMFQPTICRNSRVFCNILIGVGWSATLWCLPFFDEISYANIPLCPKMESFSCLWCFSGLLRVRIEGHVFCCHMLEESILILTPTQPNPRVSTSSP